MNDVTLFYAVIYAMLALFYGAFGYIFLKLEFPIEAEPTPPASPPERRGMTLSQGLIILSEFLIIAFVVAQPIRSGAPERCVCVGRVVSVVWWSPWTLVDVEGNDFWTIRGDYRANFTVGETYEVVLLRNGGYCRLVSMLPTS